MAFQSDETLLVSITKIKKTDRQNSGAQPDVEQSEGSSKSLLQDILLKSATSSDAENVQAFVMSSDTLGKKNYNAVKVSRIPSARKSFKDHKKSEILKKHSNIDSVDTTSSKLTDDPGLPESPKTKHIVFTDTGKENLEKDVDSLSPEGSTGLSTATNRTRYYLNYEGKLSLKQTKLAASKTFPFDIASSILSEIISKVAINSENKPLKKSITSKKIPPLLPSSTISTTYVSIREKMQMEKLEKSSDKNSEIKARRSNMTKIPQITSVVKRLALPIIVSKRPPFLDTKATVERVLVDDEVPKPATITVKANEKVPEEDFKQETEPTVPQSTLEKEHETRAPFKMRWCFGFNVEVPIVNLSTSNRSVLLFANSQFAVLHDFHENTMHFMQGHHNTVSYLASDLLGSLIVSADCGPNSRVIIWDTKPCVVAVLEEVHPKGCQMVALSCYAEYLITVSPPPQQQVQLWIWYERNKQPVGSIALNDNLGEIKKITTNPMRAKEFVLTLESGVGFVYFDACPGEKTNDSLLLDSHQLSPKLGAFTDTTFLKASALSSTTMGYVVVWVDGDGPQYKKLHEKHVRLHLEPITHIEAVDDVVAIVTVSGNVSFLDPGLTVLYWCNKLQLGRLVSLSFNLLPQTKEVFGCSQKSHINCSANWREDKQQLQDATVSHKPFSVRHFLVSTVEGRVAYINPTSDVPKYLLFPSDAVYTAMDSHPHSQYVCAGTSLGQCVLFDIDSFRIRVTHRLSTHEGMCQAISQLRYSPSGLKLACGMYTGEVWLLDPLLLSPKHSSPLCHTTDCITHMVFSPESDFLAVADTSHCLTVYSLQEAPVLVGQLRAHSKPVRDIFFVSDDGELKLLSLGADRSLVLLQIADTGDLLTLKHVQRVEQSAIPCSILPHLFSDSMLLLVNSEDKFTMLDYHSLKCCKTLQAPQLGCPITFLDKFPHDNRFLVFGTRHHIGLHVLPVDGNPFKALALRASPTPIVSCKTHHSGKYLFTISENCSAVIVWDINSPALMESYEKGGSGLPPFLTLLEEQEEKNLREFFLVGQFVHQGEQPSVIRYLGNHLPTCEITNIFQALGFFPTKHQIENILQEVDLQKQISFEQFVQLYVNHRPSHSLTVEELHLAFRDLYEGVYFSDQDPGLLRLETDPVFDSVSFVEKLMVTGEEMTYPELFMALSILVDNNTQTQPEDQLSGSSLAFMPKELSFETFVSDLLGFNCEDGC